MQEIDVARLRELRSYLDANGYDAESLSARLGSALPAARGEAQTMLDATREINTGNVLARLFLLGVTLDTSTASEFIPNSIVELLITHGFVTKDGDRIRPDVVIIPIEDLLFVSDAFHVLGGNRANEFVLPASTHSANFLRHLTMRTTVKDVLDLGCGCGIHALFAARHANHVIATDISSSAMRYTAINAALNNIDNVEILRGNLFEPVATRQFDLIISNPPFVVGPSDQYEYRDNPLDLDGFCALLIAEAPQHLTPNGHLQMLCEWVEVEGEPWRDRIAGWVRGCDAWILHALPVSPADYVAQRTDDIAGENVDAGSTNTWQDYFDDHQVNAIHPGMIVLRRSTGPHWMHIQNLQGDVTTTAGNAIANGIDAVDFLEACDDASLREATLRVSESVEIEAARDGDARLSLANGLSTELVTDRAVVAFMNLFADGRSVSECTTKLATFAESNADDPASELLHIVRVLVSRGFLEPC